MAMATNSWSGSACCRSDLRSLMITGYGTIESAVACMRAGAFDYLIKPFTPDQIEIVLKKAESHHQLVKVNRYFSEREGPFGEIVGKGSPCSDCTRSSSGWRRRRHHPDHGRKRHWQGDGRTGTLTATARGATSHISRSIGAAVSENLIESEFFGP